MVESSTETNIEKCNQKREIYREESAGSFFLVWDKTGIAVLIDVCRLIQKHILSPHFSHYIPEYIATRMVREALYIWGKRFWLTITYVGSALVLCFPN